MSEEVQVAPKWLNELEEKRERRLKARLGHEAGAGSPCLTCEEKCPGLDLHFWRKICKNCKCGKENHDVNDDDIYGWAQFQLLGSKPNKSRKFVLPGRSDAVELDWMPKGVADAVESYLKDLPLNMLPIKGSPAALERKQLLQKQIPLHDIDPTLCHALSEHEIIQMNQYIADVKQNSVGMGRIIKLNEILIANRAPMQIPQMENIILQGANHSDLLHNLKINEPKLPELIPIPPIRNDFDLQKPTNIKNIKDIYASQQYRPINGDSTGLHDYQNPVNAGKIRDVNYAAQNRHQDFSGSNISNCNTVLVDNQNPRDVHVRDIRASTNGGQISNSPGSKINPLLLPRNIMNSVDYQYASAPGYIKDVNYPFGGDSNTNRDTLNGNVNVSPNNVMYATSNRTIGDFTADSQIPRDSISNTNRPNMHDNHSKEQNLLGDLQVPNGLIRNQIDNQNPIALGQISDIRYPQFENDDFNTVPCRQTGRMPYLNNQNGPNDNLEVGIATRGTAGFNQSALGNLQLPLSAIRNQIDQQYPIRAGNMSDINYSSLADQHPNRNITSLKDLAHSTYNPQAHNSPEEIKATPMAVNIGLIKDIEYPAVKSAVHTQNISEPAVPRKNVHFNLIPDEILPSCHKCNKMFDHTAHVIGIDRTDALWHTDCFKCSGCNQNLADLMYFYDKSSDNIYCGRDYAKIRGIPRCQACDELIFVKQYCLAENSTFHVKHFCCFECDETLAGQNYVMDELNESQPLCLPCFELLKAEKCNTCLKVIKPDDKGANLNGVHFHASDECFICKTCKIPLLGAKLLFKNMTLYCSTPCFTADK